MLRVCGVVALESVLDTDVVQTISGAQRTLFDHLVDGMGGTRAAEKNSGGTVEHDDHASRGSNRYEQKFPVEKPYIDPRFTANRFVLSVISHSLGTRWRLTRSLQ